MVAVLGALILGDGVTAIAITAFIISTLGIFALSLGQNRVAISAIFDGLKRRQTLVGLLCAACLGASSVFYRGAALALHHDHIVMAAGYALSVSLLIQTVLMGGYLVIREPGEFTRVLKQWRWAGAAGFTGALASICWFTAFTAQNASYVRALGQIELVFTFIATTVFFREKVSTAELVGIILVSGGIIILVLFG
jgi:drug/metabolite transporter (DMT)-like permease